LGPEPDHPDLRIGSLKELKFEPDRLGSKFSQSQESNPDVLSKIESTGRKQKEVSASGSCTAKQGKSLLRNWFFQALTNRKKS